MTSLSFMRPRILLLAALAALSALAPARAEDASAPSPVVIARAGVHPDFDRLVFDWPHATGYAVHRDGAHVTVQFVASGRTDFKDVLSTHPARMSDFSAATDKDGHLTVTFLVAPNAGLHDFTSGNSVVIDIKGATAPAIVVMAQPKEAAVTPPVPTSVPVASAPPMSVIPPASPPVSATVPEKPAVPVPAAAPVAPVSAAPNTTPTAPPVKPLPVIGTASQLVLTLDPHVPTRTAIFQRGGYGFVVFDRKLTLSLDALTAGAPSPLIDAEPLDLPKASGWRFAMPADAELRATRNGTAWQIFLSKEHLEVPVSTALVAQPDFVLGSRLLLPLADAPEPITLTDPVVGDTLILIPLEETQAFSVSRRMADFRILPAAQGLVIKPFNDKLIARAVSDGIEITAEGGLHLSRASDTGASQQSSQKAKSAAAGRSLFDFAGWSGKPNETFTETRQRLQQTIVDVPEAERNRARLELARFYFANGNGDEAAALLHYLSVLVPDLKSHSDFVAILGASEILSARPEDGLADLENADLQGIPEIELWQAVASGELRDWPAAEEKFSITHNLLAGYPEPFYSRFSVLAVEAALAAGKDHEAKDWLDQLENSAHRTAIDPAIEYLHGVIHSKEGRAEAAEELWKEVEQSSDRLYRIRAELALIDLGVATGSLTPVKAANRLEALRFGWRGDDLELDILYRLGQFYVQAKDVKSGLNTMNSAMQLYPKSRLTQQIHAEMAEDFRKVFLGDLAPNLSAVDALTLYQQYHDLVPPGTDSDAIMRNLAERLVAIDLLDQASGLLEELIKGHLQGVEKGKVGARAAAIRLLDRKPEAAIADLDISNDNSYPADLLNERQLLHAKALAELHKDDDALKLLESNSSKEAKMLRSDITLHAQRWADAAKNLLDLIGPPPRPGETLTSEQADWLVRCAIALSLAGEQDQLNKLAVDFSAPMAAMPENDTFRVLTQPDKEGPLKDISAVQAKISDVDLFQGFLNAYRNAPANTTSGKQ